MVEEFYKLQAAYASQDAGVTYVFLFALGALLGWGIMHKARLPWLSNLYTGLVLAFYITASLAVVMMQQAAQ